MSVRGSSLGPASRRPLRAWPLARLALGALALGCSASGDEASSDPFGAAPSGSGGSSPSATAGASGGSTPNPAAGSGGASGESIPTLGVSGQNAGGAAGTGAAVTAGTGGVNAGGTAGAAGSSGANPQGSSGTGSVGSGCSGSGVFLCDDFEAATAGVFPNGPDWIPNQCTSHSVDGSVAHTGTQSLRGGAEAYPACMARADISDQTDVYARSWIQLGDVSSNSGHEIGFLEFGPTDADNPELRVGLRNNDSVCIAAPGVEVTVDGVAGGERTTCSGVALEANRWYCLEVHFSRGPGRIAFSVQIDGASVVPNTEYADAMPAWSDGPLFLKLGRSSYGGNGVWPVWHDDVVLSTQPVGCAP